MFNISSPPASKYLVLPSYVKDVRVKADQCPQSPTLAYFKKEESFELSLASRKSFEFVVSNYEGKFTGKQFKIRFLNKIKSGTSRVRYVTVRVTTKKGFVDKRSLGSDKEYAGLVNKISQLLASLSTNRQQLKTTY